MRKIYLKSLLVAVALTMGVASVSADVKTIYEKSLTGTTSWSVKDYEDGGVWVVGASTVEVPADGGLYVTGNRRSSDATGKVVHTSNSVLTVDAVWNTGNAYGSSNDYTYFKMGSDIVLKCVPQEQKAYAIVNGTSNVIPNANGKANSNRDGDVWTIHAEINTATNTLVSLTIVGSKGNKKVNYSLAGQPLSTTSTYDTYSFGSNRGRDTGIQKTGMQSIKVSEEVQSVTPATYAVNYTYNGVAVLSEKGESAAGAVIMAQNSIEVDGTRYFVVDGAETSKTLVAGANTFDVAVRQAKVYNYDVKDNLGTVLGTGKWTEGDADVTVSWSKYVKKEGKWYICEGTTFGETIGGALEADVTKVVNYVEASDIDFFLEGESILSGSYGNATGNSFSGGASAGVALGKSLNIGLVPAGTYDLTLQTSVRRPNADKFNVEVSADNAVWQTVNTLELADNKGGAFGLVLSLGTDSYVRLTEALAQNQCHYVDYVTLTAKSAPTVEINAASKVASYSSAQTVTVPEDVMIYIATETSASEIVLTKVEGRVVPANTGVVLYSATPGMKTLAYGGEATADFAANKFVATGDATFAATGSEYALVKGEQSFAKVAAGVEIPANKAYVVAAAGAKLNLDFGTLTAIEGVEAAAASSDAIYNLAGQKVSASYKGIVVKGGKKYIVK